METANSFKDIILCQWLIMLILSVVNNVNTVSGVNNVNTVSVVMMTVGTGEVERCRCSIVWDRGQNQSIINTCII